MLPLLSGGNNAFHGFSLLTKDIAGLDLIETKGHH